MEEYARYASCNFRKIPSVNLLPLSSTPPYLYDSHYYSFHLADEEIILPRENARVPRFNRVCVPLSPFSFLHLQRTDSVADLRDWRRKAESRDARAARRGEYRTRVRNQSTAKFFQFLQRAIGKRAQKRRRQRGVSPVIPDEGSEQCRCAQIIRSIVRR